ncbi:MAG: basic amino acid/polyamine antiporter [Lactobacillus sp.]|nr:basic amino acid/polyamine antiporter [Lactobacillus sp.]
MEKLSKRELIAIIVSSSLGAGIYGIVKNMAQAAGPGPAIMAWAFSAVGILLLVLCLNNLSQKRPDLDGGIFSYAGAGFGKIGEFLAGWSYWLAAWMGNIAFATMLMSTLGTYFPSFGNGQNIQSIIVSIALCWGLAFLVNLGIKTASVINAIGTIFKIVPLIIFAIVAVLAFKTPIFTADFWGRAIHNGVVSGSSFSQVNAALMTIIWVFMGIEGASIMSSRAQSRKEAEQATIIGFIFLVLIYMVISILPYGTLSRASLANLKQPAIASVLQHLVGSWGAFFINIGLMISSFISWLSWTMLPAETTNILAKDRVLPAFWGKQNSKQAPTSSLFIVAALQTIVLISLLFTSDAYTFVYSLCAASILIAYIFVCCYQIKYSWERKEKMQLVIGILALSFQLVCALLAGFKQVLMVSLTFIPGLAVYYESVREDNRKLNKNEKLVFILVLIFCIFAIWILFPGK